MQTLSTSLTLGKASTGNANLEHNSREIIAKNVDVNRICLNKTYVDQDVRAAYEELFSESVAEYNAKQKQPCRRIKDYFDKIESGRREEAFYELVVQFGDMKSAGVGTPNGEIAAKMLDEYVRSFQQRNPNLYVFSAHAHMDEASPHVHIDIIPFYTKGRKNGLSKGVSMKSALIEMGFNPRGQNQNQLVLWQDSERKVMEQILQSHGFEREVKNANHVHQSVPDYKSSQDRKKLIAHARNAQQVDPTIEEVVNLQRANCLLEVENEKLVAEKSSPWKSFFYSDENKLNFVSAELDRLTIPYRTTENGFEAQQIFAEQIRKIEKQYKPKENSHRSTLHDILDKVIMQSKNYDEVLQRIQDNDCEIKRGKYLAVRPQYATNFIRTKSLGADYSEQGIRNRLTRKLQFEQANEVQINSTKPDTLEHMTYKTIRHYTVVFAAGVLPVHKRNKKKIFSWENCEELNKLADLNRRINSGANLTSLQNEFKSAEETVAREVNLLERIKADTTLPNRIYNAGFNYFNYGNATDKEKELLRNFRITIDNYKDSENVVVGYIERIEKSLSANREKLREASDTLALAEKVMGGTLVQSYIDEEKNRKQSAYVPNGIKSADDSKQNEKIEEVIRTVVSGMKH